MKYLIFILLASWASLASSQDFSSQGASNDWDDSFDNEAGQIFTSLAPALYQIKLIETASGEKSAIGSGFQISADGLIATNYHVISGYARHPGKYRIEYLNHLGEEGELTLVNIDVINDLAITRLVEKGPTDYFEIAGNPPVKGEQIFSLGNPHDLGMIVVPGTYNGLKKESFNDKIHFTGAVNSGMSGGPVVNAHGDVVGINVATSGNQIGFLIPHQKLEKLFAKTRALDGKPADITKTITEQLHQNQARFIGHILEQEWQPKGLGGAYIPMIDVPFIRCWGDSNAQDQQALFFTAVSQCRLEESVFISGRFNSGTFEMDFRWLHSDELNAIRFSRLYEQQIANAGPGNRAYKDDITEFACQDDIVSAENSNMNNKVILCTRAYKEYQGLFDMLFVSASIDENQRALISHFTLSGVTQESGLRFTRKFMESVSWK